MVIGELTKASSSTMTATSSSARYAPRKLFAAIASVLVVCVASALAWRLLGKPSTGIDDADIFLVYARNFVRGHGMVYNVGGEHVEGFSSFLFFLVCSAVYLCSSNPAAKLFFIGLLFTILSTYCALTLIARIAERLALPRSIYLLLSAAYLLWIGFNPLYFAWNVVALMDASLYSLVLTASFALLATIFLEAQPPIRKHSLLLAIMIALTILVRPEGLLWAPLILVAFAWIAFNLSPSPQQALRRLILPLVSLIATTAALISFRLAYFGYPFPNTYYAKVTAPLLKSLGDGRRYFYIFKDLYGIFIFIPIFIGLAWLGYILVTRKHRSVLFNFALLTTVFCSAAFVLPIIEGGEHFTSCRMYQSVFPLLFFSLMLPVLFFSGRAAVRAQFGYVIFLTALVGFTTTCSWHTFAINNMPDRPVIDSHMTLLSAFTLTIKERDNGMRLHRLFADQLPTTGVAAAGGFAYGYNGTVYDLLGLNDVRMAHADKIKQGPKDHQSFNKNVFYQISPDIVVPCTMVGNRLAPEILALNQSYANPDQWENLIFKRIFLDNRFKSTYTAALVSNDHAPGISCYGFFNNQYLSHLATDKAIHIIPLPAPR